MIEEALKEFDDNFPADIGFNYTKIPDIKSFLTQFYKEMIEKDIEYAQELRDRWELKYHESLKQYPECTWNSAIDEILSDLKELENDIKGNLH